MSTTFCLKGSIDTNQTGLDYQKYFLGLNANTRLQIFPGSGALMGA